MAGVQLEIHFVDGSAPGSGGGSAPPPIGGGFPPPTMPPPPPAGASGSGPGGGLVPYRPPQFARGPSPGATGPAGGGLFGGNGGWAGPVFIAGQGGPFYQQFQVVAQHAHFYGGAPPGGRLGGAAGADLGGGAPTMAEAGAAGTLSSLLGMSGPFAVLATGVAALNVVMSKLTVAVEAETAMIAANNTFRAAMIRGEDPTASAARQRLAEVENNARIISLIPGVGPVMAGAYRASESQDPTRQLGFAERMQAMEERIRRLSRYNPTIARQQGLNQMWQVERDFAEANGPLGDQFAKTSWQTEDYRAKAQTLQALRAAVERQALEREISKRVGGMEKEIEALRKQLGPVGDKIIDALKGLGKKSIMEQFLQGMTLPTDGLPDRERALDRLRNSAAAKPIFGGR